MSVSAAYLTPDTPHCEDLNHVVSFLLTFAHATLLDYDTSSEEIPTSYRPGWGFVSNVHRTWSVPSSVLIIYLCDYLTNAFLPCWVVCCVRARLMHGSPAIVSQTPSTVLGTE